MPEVYRSAAIETNTEGGVVVVHCSDPRYQPHFQDFLRNGLGLANYALVAVPGGPQLLARLDFLPKFAWSGWCWLKFIVDLTRTQRLILIAHDDCRWYFSLALHQDPARVRERQLADLRSIRAELTERFKIASTELYYARLENDRASFEIL